MKKMIYLLVILAPFHNIFGQPKVKVEDLSRLVCKLYVEGKIHGGVLIAEGNEILYKDAWGIANKSKGIVLKGDEQFSINSMGKMFTAILILQLVEEGKLSLDDKLDELIPDFNHPRSSEITLHHLLAHRSGLKDYYILQMTGQMSEGLSKEEMLSEISKRELKFDPGTKFNYSNTGYVLLGSIIEKYRKIPLDEVLKERIFDPLSMNNSVLVYKYDLNKLPQYFLEDGTILTQGYDIYGGDGAELSTLEDMYKFMFALGSEKLLSKEMWELAFTPHSLPSEVPADAWPPPHQNPYGYGFSLMELPFNGNTTAKAVGHGGAGMGSNIAVRYLDSKRIIINWNNIFKDPKLSDLFNYLAGNTSD